LKSCASGIAGQFVGGDRGRDLREPETDLAEVVGYPSWTTAGTSSGSSPIAT